jgi:hypothetical protein
MQQTKQNCFLNNIIFTELEIIEQSNHSVRINDILISSTN